MTHSMIKTECLATHLSEPFLSIQKKIVQQSVAIEDWFSEEWKKTTPPIYCSVDLRNSGYKLAPIDTNLFPAGFNNLNSDFKNQYIDAARKTVQTICPDIKKLLIIPESHTRNLFYFESLGNLQEIFESAGLEVRIGTLNEEIKSPLTVELKSGKKMILYPLIRKDNQVGVEDFFSCCILLNNDLSSGVPEILKDLKQVFLPAIHLGWYTRLKSEHFRFYEQVVNEFAQQFSFDHWALFPMFDQCPAVDFMQKDGERCLVERAEKLFVKIKDKYRSYQIDEKPFLVIKADQGTYGMAVMMIHDPEELKNLNRKQRTHMSTSKGGKRVTKAIIQEGVYTREIKGEDQSVAEPVIYMIGSQVIGGFYRIHKEKGVDENLNSPGMDFYPLSFSSPCDAVHLENKLENPFYVYGVVARLALVAAARELATFKKKNYD